MLILKTSSNVSGRETLPESVSWIDNEGKKLWSSFTAEEGAEFITDVEEQRMAGNGVSQNYQEQAFQKSINWMQASESCYF